MIQLLSVLFAVLLLFSGAIFGWLVIVTNVLDAYDGDEDDDRG